MVHWPTHAHAPRPETDTNTDTDDPNHGHSDGDVAEGRRCSGRPPAPHPSDRNNVQLEGLPSLCCAHACALSPERHRRPTRARRCSENPSGARAAFSLPIAGANCWRKLLAPSGLGHAREARYPRRGRAQPRRSLRSLAKPRDHLISVPISDRAKRLLSEPRRQKQRASTSAIAACIQNRRGHARAHSGLVTLHDCLSSDRGPFLIPPIS